MKIDLGKWIKLGLLLATLSACAGGGGLKGNQNGSVPVNNDEEKRYKQAILRCYKTGGSRIVKIQGYLRCF